MTFNCINNAKEKRARHSISPAKHDIIVQWGLREVIIKQSTVCAFSITIDERTTRNWAAMVHLVVLLIEKVLDDQVVISDSTTYRLFFFFETIDHLHIIIVIWRGWRRWRVWWIYEIGIHFERENFWVSKVVGIACSLQWETWNASVIYRKILESIEKCENLGINSSLYYQIRSELIEKRENLGINT